MAASGGEMKDFLDEEAQVDLDNFIALRNGVLETREQWRALVNADRRVSQLISHGRVTEEMRERMLTVFYEIDGFILAHPLFQRWKGTL